MFIAILNEFYRILKPGGICNVIVPYYHASTAYSNGHKLWFQNSSFPKITDPKNIEYYNRFYPFKCVFDFALVRQYLHPTPLGRLFFLQKIRLAASVVFGEIVDEIRVTMRAVKPARIPLPKLRYPKRWAAPRYTL